MKFRYLVVLDDHRTFGTNDLDIAMDAAVDNELVIDVETGEIIDCAGNRTTITEGDSLPQEVEEEEDDSDEQEEEEDEETSDELDDDTSREEEEDDYDGDGMASHDQD
jgi:hypothetical protein